MIFVEPLPLSIAEQANVDEIRFVWNQSDSFDFQEIPTSLVVRDVRGFEETNVFESNSELVGHVVAGFICREMSTFEEELVSKA